MTLDEFSEMLNEEEVEGLLDVIYDLEMDEVMNYDQEGIKEFESNLYEEATVYKRKQEASNDSIKMERIISHLEKYGR